MESNCFAYAVIRQYLCIRVIWALVLSLKLPSYSKITAVVVYYFCGVIANSWVPMELDLCGNPFSLPRVKPNTDTLLFTESVPNGVAPHLPYLQNLYGSTVLLVSCYDSIINTRCKILKRKTGMQVLDLNGGHLSSKYPPPTTIYHFVRVV